jgi:transcriptional antiterminator RfaH
MPILATETSIFPVNLLDQSQFECTFEVDVQAWWVFYTRARQEKSLARDLLQREIAFYLPLVPRRLLIRGRPIFSQVPVFAGYLFVHGTEEDRVRALKTNRVAQVLPVSDTIQLLADLRNLQQLIDIGTPLTVESRLLPQQRVRIRSGALAGMEGTVTKRRNETRLVVWVNMLQQGVSLEIDDFLLEPVG